MQLRAMPELTDDNGTIARLISYLPLVKYGYDIRGFIAPERVWEENSPTYNHLLTAFLAKPNLSLWIEYICETYITALEHAYDDLTTSRFHIEFPTAFWVVTDRQKAIMSLLDNPNETLTNKKIQRKLHITQLTASRDLSRLTTLGLLHQHGKGRSIYYMKM